MPTYQNPIASLYPQAPQTNGAMVDPMSSIVKAIQMRNLMNNINKVRGGMPMTQNSLGQLGAGQAYDSGQ